MRTRDWVAAGFGCAALATSVLAIGSAPRWAQALVAMLVAAGLTPLVLSRQVFDRRSPLVVVIGTAAALSVLQLLPLPVWVLDKLTPITSTLREDGAALLGTSPWRAITADAPGTLRGVAFFIILLGASVLALRIATSERGRYRIIVAVAAVCGLTATIVGMHELVGARALFGVYEPAHARPTVLGPLLNENHLGCLMALGASLSIGLVMYRRQPSWVRVIWLVCVGACGAVAVASHSRGAALALVGGIAVTLGILLGQRFATATTTATRRRSRFLTSSLPIGIVGACAVIVVLYASAGSVSTELQRTSLAELHAPKSKFSAWRSAVRLVEESPIVGVGRGAFEAAFTRVHPASALATFSHLENAYIQAVVDWGVPGALLVGLATTWLFVFALRRWRDGPLAAGAFGAFAVVALQSNVDFGIELLGVALPTVAVIATLTYVPLREAERGQRVRARAIRVAHLAGLAAAAAVLLSSMTTSIAEDHEALADEAKLTLDDLTPVIERHPLDYLGYALASRVMLETGDSRAVRLLNHALTLHPTHPGLHHLAARLLITAHRPDQAAMEYAAALRGTVEPRPLLLEILPQFDAERAAAAIPTDQRIDDIVQILEENKRPDVTSSWLLRVIDARPSTVRACELLFDLSLRRGDVKMTQVAGRRCSGFEPSRETLLELAEVLSKRDDFAGVLELLRDVETWPGLITDKLKGMYLLCEAHAGLQHWDDARRCFHRIETSGYLPKERKDEIPLRLELLLKQRIQAEAAAAGSASDPVPRPDDDAAAAQR